MALDVGSLVIVVAVVIIVSKSKENNSRQLETEKSVAWSQWSICSAQCSSSMNPVNLKCPTKTRSRLHNEMHEHDETTCNCVQCPFRYGAWNHDRCSGEKDCSKVMVRYCQMVMPNGLVLHDSRGKVDKRLFKCGNGWKDELWHHWDDDCNTKCSTCKKWGLC